MSSTEVTERGPYKDRTRLISCSATAGINNSDRALSEAVTGCTGDTVHHHGNVLSVFGCDGRMTGRTKKQSLIMSRKVLEQRQRDQTCQVDYDQTW